MNSHQDNSDVLVLGLLAGFLLLLTTLFLLSAPRGDGLWINIHHEGRPWVRPWNHP